MTEPAPVCRAMSRRIARDADSYMICVRDAGHAGAHSACDGEGHVLARWISSLSKVEVFGPWGVVVR